MATAQERLDAVRTAIDTIVAGGVAAHGTPEYNLTKLPLDVLMRYERKLEADAQAENPISPINYAQFVRGDEAGSDALA